MWHHVSFAAAVFPLFDDWRNQAPPRGRCVRHPVELRAPKVGRGLRIGQTREQIHTQGRNPRLDLP